MSLFSLFRRIAAWFRDRKKPIPVESKPTIEPSTRTEAKPEYNHQFVEDIPKKMEARCIYVVGTQPYHWAIVFYCPCGCERQITLNTLEDTFPSWSYRICNGSITIKPSIRRLSGCRSHFFIRKGNVVWSKDD